jgi:hypothetical protein
MKANMDILFIHTDIYDYGIAIRPTIMSIERIRKRKRYRSLHHNNTRMNDIDKRINS